MTQKQTTVPGVSRRQVLQVAAVGAAGVGLGISARPVAAAEDLSSVDIAYYGGSGRQRSAMTNDLESRNATVSAVSDLTQSTLGNYDIVWIDEAGGSISGTEQNDLEAFVNNGGGVLFHGDGLETSIEQVATNFGTTFEATDGTGGDTTDIVDDYITDGVTTVNLPAPLATLSVTSPAEMLVRDSGGAGHIAKSESGSGRVVAIADDDLFGNTGGPITQADNRLLGNQAFDWLAGFGSDGAVFTEPIAAMGQSIGPPQDCDGDGLYEDVTGDGQVNARDQQALSSILASHTQAKKIRLDPGESDGLFQRLTDAQIQAFDFNEDGKFGPQDVVELSRQINRGTACGTGTGLR